MTRGNAALPRRPRLACGIAAICLSVSVLGAAAEERAGATGTSVVKKVYANGLTLLVDPDPGGLVSVNLLARMGPLYEEPRQRGISSLMLRCLLYGGTVHRSSQEISRELESAGASWDQFVTPDFGDLWLRVPRPGLDKALEVFFDILQNPSFREDDVRIGKGEKAQTIATRSDEPFYAAASLFRETFYGDHPYCGLPEGRIETVQALARQDLVAWHRRIFIPNNMVIVVSGDVDPDDMIRKFGAAFGAAERGRLPRKAPRPRPAAKKDVTAVRTMQVRGAYLILGYRAPSVSDDDTPVMDLINHIVGNRLFTELRDKRGMAYVVTSAYESMVGPSAITAVMLTDPARYQEAKAGIVAEFQKLREEPVSEAELEAAKRNRRGLFIMSKETGLDRGRTLGIFELELRGYRYAETYLAAVAAVRPGDIERTAKRYFRRSVLAVVASEGSITE